MSIDIPESIYDEDLPQPRMLTEEESIYIREHLAQKNFGMSVAEFTNAWLAGEFDDDPERHGEVQAFAMMLPEYWEESEPEAKVPTPSAPVEFSTWRELEDIGAGDGLPTECERCGKPGTPRQQFTHMGVIVCFVCARERSDELGSEGS